MKLLLINGPNLNMLGKREPETYGYETFADILAELRDEFADIHIEYFQSNYEGAILEQLHQAMEADEYEGVVINGGALTHYSYALHDAIKMLSIPAIEVHMSHIFNREPFRHTSVISPACRGMISGFGKDSYRLGILALLEVVEKR